MKIRSVPQYWYHKRLTNGFYEKNTKINPVELIKTKEKEQ
jgi:hypothetical protein